MKILKRFINISLAFFISLVIGCSDDVDFKPLGELGVNGVESRSSKAFDAIVPINIVVEIAEKYPIIMQNRMDVNDDVIVRREVQQHFTLPDNKGIPALYVFTYKNNLGYLVVSAEWRHEPICAVTRKGTYPDIEAPSALIEWFESTIENIEYIRYSNFENSSRATKAWKAIDEALDIQGLVLPEDECCEACPNYPECEFDIRIGCGGNSEELCDGITDDNPCGNWTYTTVGPLLTTEWGQHCSFNNLCIEEKCNGNLMDCPGNCNQNPLTGCVATAMAQVIRYWQIPSLHGYNYTSMPNNYGNFEVQQLMYDAGCSVDMNWGCSSSGAYGNKVPGALKNDFGFSSANRTSYGTGDYQVVVDNLNNDQPVLFEGCRTKKTFLGITYQYDGCHEWVCDGYFRSKNNCHSYLQFHMNWGWRGYHDGWFAFNNWNIPAINRNYTYANHFVHEIQP